MNEILFRAKVLTCTREYDDITKTTTDMWDYHDWAYGLCNLVALTNDGPWYEFVTFDKGKLMFLGPGETYAYKPETYCYDPDTVSQFTGMLDKNDKNIFEGDIIRFNGGYALGRWTGIVEYENKCACFVVKGTRVKFSSDDPGTFKVPLFDINKDTIEVIGNKFDNPDA